MNNVTTTLLVTLLLNATGYLFAQTTPDNRSPEGRWNLTLDINGTEKPSWLNIQRSGHRTFVGWFVGMSGSARPVSEIIIDNTQFRFTIPPQWEEGDASLSVEGRVNDDGLTGTITLPDGNVYTWRGVRAPRLAQSKPPLWDEPISLIDKNGLHGWRAIDGENHWVVEDGVLRNQRAGANLVTEQKFTDFKLHVEFRYPAGSNSGVYLRGRYEVQIMDHDGSEARSTGFGGVYGFLTPNEQVAAAPGEWQTFDITLVGRTITLVANGKEIICRQEIPGITGGALDSREGEPGPLMLQGDHGVIEFRNIILTPAQ